MASMEKTARGSVTALGWDLVSSIKISALNQAIAEAGRTPPGFGGSDGEGGTVNCRFGPWEIGDESEGHILSMRVPLCEIEWRGGAQTKRFERAMASVDLRLEYLPHGPQAANGTQTMLLVLDCGDPRRNSAPVSVTNLEIDGAHGVLDQIHVMAALEAWLQQNLAEFSHVLAAVTLREMVDEAERFAWMKPTYLAYAFGRNAIDPSQSILSVLSQTGGRSADGLPYQTMSTALPGGAEAGFIISRKRFLTDVIRPALPMAFPGLSNAQLTYLPEDTGVALKDTPVPLEPVEYEGETYTPDLLRLEVRLYDTYMATKTETRTKVAPGVWAHCAMGGSYGLKLTTRDDGKRAMQVVERETSEPETWKEVSKGTKVTKLILAIIAGLAGLVIAIFTWGFGVSAAAPIYFALYGSLVGMTALQAAELFSSETSPALDLLETEIDETLAWSTGNVFTPTSIDLAYALRIGGTTQGDRRLKGLSAAPAAAFQERFDTRMRARLR